MNYITHLNSFMELAAADDRLTPHHVSLYLALFQFWNKSRFPYKITIYRNEVLQVSKIGSSKTYYKCLHELHDFGYIGYEPSFNPMKGSTITLQVLPGAPMDQKSSQTIAKDGRKGACRTKKISSEQEPTQVAPGYKDPRSLATLTTGGTQPVAPFIVNCLNKSNNKQCVTRDHEKKRAKARTGINTTGEGRNSRRGSLHSVVLPPSRSGATKKGSAARPALPSLCDVQAFFAKMTTEDGPGKTLDPASVEWEAKKFFYHFESNGWLIGGKSPMQNWEAACLSWAAKMPIFNLPERRSTRKNHLHVAPDGHLGTPL